MEKAKDLLLPKMDKRRKGEENPKRLEPVIN